MKTKITQLQANGEWQQILQLLKCETSINPDLDRTLFITLPFYYSKVAGNLILIEFKQFYHYFHLFQESSLLVLELNDLTAKERKKLYNTLAYAYYSIYSNGKLWAAKFITKNLSCLAESERKTFTRDFFRNNVLLFYYKALEIDPNDIKTNYRFAHLLEDIRKFTLQKKPSITSPLKLTENLVINKKEDLIKFLNFVNKNGIPVIWRYYDRNFLELHYYECAIILYENLP